MTGTLERPRCLLCERDSNIVPLVAVRYQDGDWWICTQHFPTLIHQPEQLADRLPGAESFASDE